MKISKMDSEPMDPETMKLDGFHKHEIESAARTLTEAEDIKSNRKLMKHVHKHLNGKMRAIRSIAQLKDRAQEMAEGKNPAKEAKNLDEAMEGE